MNFLKIRAIALRVFFLAIIVGVVVYVLTDVQGAIRLAITVCIGFVGVIAVVVGTFVILNKLDKLRRKTLTIRQLRFLDGDDEKIREAAIRALGKLHHALALPKLLEALHDENPNIREASIMALGQVHDSKTVPALLEILHNQTLPTPTREAAAKALGAIGSYSYDEQLAKALVEEKSPRVRIAIMDALLILSKKLLKDAESAESDPPKHRENRPAVLTIDYLPPEHFLKAIREYIVPGLEKSLYSIEREEREVALTVLKQIGTPEAQAAVDKALNVSSSDTVQFSAYYPVKAQIDVLHGLYVYAHLQSAIGTIEKDIQKFKEELGGEVPEARNAKQSAQLRRNTPIIVVPECEEVEFNPISLTKKWDTDWVRFDFDFKAKKELLDDTLFVRVSIQVNGVEISHIKCSINVIDQKVQSEPITAYESPENRLRTAELNAQTTGIYQKIFISYSRKDKEVVEAYRLAQLAVGNDVFMDTYSLKPGEDWQGGLARAIKTAEIFQLFWSENSATSTNVHDEWDYALKYRCPETKCADFIRPVFWINPMPVKPPNELVHLNFRYVPLKPLEASSSSEQNN